MTSPALQTHCTELLEGYPAVAVLVSVDDGLVDDLLQLCVFQVVAHHHLQHLEQLAVGDVAVLVHVVDPEGNWEEEKEEDEKQTHWCVKYRRLMPEVSFLRFLNKVLIRPSELHTESLKQGSRHHRLLI